MRMMVCMLATTRYTVTVEMEHPQDADPDAIDHLVQEAVSRGLCPHITEETEDDRIVLVGTTTTRYGSTEEL
jgi:hypothetical protein